MPAWDARTTAVGLERRKQALPWALAIALLLAGCGTAVTPAPSVPAASASPSALPTAHGAVQGLFDIGAYSLWLECEGTGSPTILLESGLGSSSTQWQELMPDLAKLSRVCAYDRAGNRRSEELPGSPPMSVEAYADDLARLLDAAGEEGPYLDVGYSFGGLIAQLFASRHLADMAGLVLVDSSSRHQFDPEWASAEYLGTVDWKDVRTPIDGAASAEELATVDSLGSLPLVVLTQGQMGGSFERAWSSFQDELATLSTDALHVVARDSDHGIPDQAPALIVEAVSAVIDDARSGSGLPLCGPRFEAVGAECLATTMTDLLAAWDAERSAVAPVAGDMPSGVYEARITGAQDQAATGHDPSFDLIVVTVTLADGHWHFSLVEDGGEPFEAADVYAVDGSEVTFRLPDDARIPRTPGVNRLRWSVDADGTLQFEQIDDALREVWFSVPWVRVGDATS